MIYLVAIWLIIAVGIIALALWRNQIAQHEDTMLHLAPAEGSRVENQVSTARKLGTLDHWGKSLTIGEILFGISLAAFYLYNVWVKTNEL
jgi:cell division protein FtsI/penicillin-binding protein 2